MQMISVDKLSEQLGVSPSFIWRKIKDDPTFPQPIKISHRVTRWKVSEVEAFVQRMADGAAK